MENEKISQNSQKLEKYNKNPGDKKSFNSYVKSKKKTFKAKPGKDKDLKTSMSAPQKMQLLFTIVNREKADFYVDLLHNFEVNLQMILSAHGTASDHIISLLGLTDSDKSVVISAIRRDKAKEALSLLEEKFRTVKGGKGVAFTVPISSTIGVAIYQFLSNTVNGGMR